MKIKISIVDDDGQEQDYILHRIPQPSMMGHFISGLAVDAHLLIYRSDVISEKIKERVREQVREILHPEGNIK